MAKKNPYGEQTQDYLASLEEKLKLKRGGFSAVGEDVNPGAYRLAGRQLGSPVLPGAGVQLPGVDRQPIADAVMPPVDPMQMPQGQQGGRDNIFSRENVLDLSNRVREDSGGQAGGSQVPQPVQQQPDGGTLYNDDIVRYQDGTEMSQGGVRQEAAYPIQTTENGVLYSDNSIRSGSLVFTGRGFVDFNDYLGNLSGGTLGEQNITGEFGDRYGFATEGTNIGTDIASNQPTSIYAPVGGTVISVNRFQHQIDPNTGQVVGASGVNYSQDDLYGNSILMQMPNGEHLRFSHLSNEQLANIQPGQQITEGTYLGQMGDTGNTTGTHLDNEYIDAQGNIKDAREFVDRITNDAAYRGSFYGDNAFGDSDITKDSQGGEILGFQDTVENIRDRQEGRDREDVRLREAQTTGAPQRPRDTADLASDVVGQDVQNIGQQVGQLGASLNIPELGASELAQNIGAKIKDPITPGKYLAQGRQGLQSDAGITEGLNQAGIQTSKGKWNVPTPFGEFNVPEIGGGDGISGKLNTGLQNAVENIGGALSGKTGVQQSGISTEGAVTGKTQLAAGGIRDTISEVLGNASSMVENLKTGGGVQKVYADEGSPGQQSAGNQLTSVQRGDAQQSFPQEQSYDIKSIKQNVGQSQMSPLLQRIYDMEQGGKTNVNSKKAAKLYNRYQQMRSDAERQVPRELLGTPEGDQMIMQSISGATRTGYSSVEADKRAQSVKAEKEKYYQSKGAYAGLPDKGSYDKMQSYLSKNKTGVPSGTGRKIEESMNVNPFGSAVRYGGQTTGQESLSNVGEQGSDWGELGQDFISMSAPQQSSAAASNAMNKKNPLDRLVGDLFKRLGLKKDKNPYRK